LVLHAQPEPAIEAAIAEQLLRFRRTRLADACARLDPAEERALAEEGFSADVAWPEYQASVDETVGE